MPLYIEDIEKNGVPISFLKEGEVRVRVGPCSAQAWHKEKIPMDGRHFICAGTIILKNGTRLQANFEINTHTFDFLERDSVIVFIASEKAWYFMKEKELYEILKISEQEAFPYTWLPDRPLDYSNAGPYLMKWPNNS